MDHISGHRLPDCEECTGFGPWAQGEFTADELARIGAHVRTLVIATKAIHKAAHPHPGVTSGRRIVEIFCDAILADMAALADPDGAHPGAYDATVALQEDERELRLGRLLADGKGLADACEAGAFDDTPHALARLAPHAHRLGERYVRLLAFVSRRMASHGYPPPRRSR